MVTTVVYDGKYMACDSMFTDESGVGHEYNHYDKIRIINNIVIGMAGTFLAMEMFVDYLHELQVSDDTSIIYLPDKISEDLRLGLTVLLYQNGNCTCYHTNINSTLVDIYEVDDHPTAIGSGRKYITKLDNAIEAVNEAIMHDPHSGGVVKYINLHNLADNNLGQ